MNWTAKLPTTIAAFLLQAALASAAQPQPVPVPVQVASAHALESQRLITQHTIRRWTDTDGLPQNSLNAMAQTSDGFLWLASEEGLIRFDGARFVVYNAANTPQLALSQMLALAAAPDGTLYIGTAGSGLVRHRRGAFAAVAREGLPSSRVQAVAVAGGGTVWAGTNRGLARIAPDGSVRVFTVRDGLPHDDVSTLLVVGDTLWAGTRTGLARVDASGVGVAAGTAGRDVRAVTAARAGGVWVGTNGGGVLRVHGDVAHVLDARLGRDMAMAIVEDEFGAVWIATNGGGLRRWRDGQMETLNNSNGGADLAWDLLRSRDGSLWVATNGRGLLQLRRTPFLPLGEVEGLSGEITLALLQTREGDRWIGTAGAGLNRIDSSGRITHFGTAAGLPGTILSLAQSADGDVWVGSHNGSLTRFRSGRFTPVGEQLGVSHAIMAILPDADGGLWLGTTGGVQYVRDGRVHRIRSDDGLADDFVMTLHRSRGGDLWVGTRQGVSRIRDGRVQPTGVEADLAGVAVGAFHEPADGSIWAATQGHGIARLAGGAVRFLNAQRGLCEDMIHAIVDGGDGGIWMSSNRGILRVSAAQVHAFFDGQADGVACQRFDRGEGMRSREANGGFMPASARLHDGTLLFPTMQGVVAVPPGSGAAGGAVAHPMLDLVVAGGDTIPAEDLSQVTLARAMRELELHFTAPAFGDTDRVRFRFRLDGFDRAWRDAGSRRSAHYTNLPPGEYQFRLAVADEAGEWHEMTTTLPVVVPARFYEARWFMVVCLLLLLGVFSRFFRQRMAAVRSRAERLSALVEERTRAEQRYRDLFENASDMVFTTDPAGTIVAWNAQAAELTGVAAEQAVGADIAGILPEIGSISNRARRDITFTRGTGDPAAVEITTRAIMEDDRLVGYQVIGRDVYEYRRMQSQLQHAARMEAIGQLAGGVAHDFNNLLTIITSYSDIVADELPRDSAIRSDVNQISEAARSAARLTGQLLAFSRRQVLQPRILDVNEETRRLAGMLRRVIGVGITVDLELVDDVWPIHADAAQLEQVLMNLALNARDAMPAGGTLLFRTRNVDVRRGEMHRLGLPDGRYVGLIIEDTGLGIEPGALPHLFEPFFTTKEAGRGTGLGLATVYGVVKQSGGHIFVDSTPGIGTRFRIYLPVPSRTELLSTSTAARPEAPAPTATARILLVEDERAVNMLACRLLKRNGFDVLTAADGYEALRMIAQHGAVDLLLTDIMMPGMSGRELAFEVQRLHPDTSILYMSGYTEDEVVRRGALPPGEQFLAKPFTPAELLQAVAEALAHRDASGASRIA